MTETMDQKISKLLATMKNRLSPERYAHFIAVYENLKKRNEVKTNA